MFWDSSAIVPLLLSEPRSRDLAKLVATDTEPAVWWATAIECLSALQRQHRDAALSAQVRDAAITRLRGIVSDMDVVTPSDPVLRHAERLIATHPLRAADALQIAAALVWCEATPASERVVSLDRRLRDAAVREGFSVLPERL